MPTKTDAKLTHRLALSRAVMFQMAELQKSLKRGKLTHAYGLAASAHATALDLLLDIAGMPEDKLKR